MLLPMGGSLMSEVISIASRSGTYQVLFTENILEIIKAYSNETIFIIDEKLQAPYRDIYSAIRNPGRCIIVNALEQNKTVNYCQQLIKALVRLNVRKNYTLVAIGGGIVQDITGFIASMLFRGVRWQFIPTTLLAQADSCIGSKTSMNLDEYKNILGGFYPPSKIYIDIQFLDTLPTKEIKSGIGEILHFYFIANSPLLYEMINNYEELLLSRHHFKKFISESLSIKKELIEIDEYDQKERNIFNYGHTFGHAIESISNYEVPHGQAVTIGMDIANYISKSIYELSINEFNMMHDILIKNFPSYQIPTDKTDDYFVALSKDKKNIGKNLGCILTDGIGSMWKAQIPLDGVLKSTISEYFEYYDLFDK